MLCEQVDLLSKNLKLSSKFLIANLIIVMCFIKCGMIVEIKCAKCNVKKDKENVTIVRNTVFVAIWQCS